MTILNEAITFMPKDPGIHINRGDTYRELKKYNLKMSHYQNYYSLFTHKLQQ